VRGMRLMVAVSRMPIVRKPGAAATLTSSNSETPLGHRSVAVMRKLAKALDVPISTLVD